MADILISRYFLFRTIKQDEAIDSIAGVLKYWIVYSSALNGCIWLASFHHMIENMLPELLLDGFL